MWCPDSMQRRLTDNSLYPCNRKVGCKVQGYSSQETGPAAFWELCSCVNSYHLGLGSGPGSAPHLLQLLPDLMDWFCGFVDLCSSEWEGVWCERFLPKAMEHRNCRAPGSDRLWWSPSLSLASWLHLFKSFTLSEPWGSCKREIVTPPSIAGISWGTEGIK